MTCRARGSTGKNLIHSSLTGEVTRDVAYTYDRDRVLTATTSSTLSYMSKLERWTYDDERGHVLRYERDDAPQPTLDGKPDYIEIYTYADNGQLLRMDRDRDGDGMIEPSDYDTFTYDAYGCIATKSDGSSGYRDLQRYTLNPACKPLEIDHDTNSDGAIDYTETWTYLYNVLPNDYHNSNDGRGYWSYDDQRRLTADTMQTQLINGSIDENSYSYDCGM